MKADSVHHRGRSIDLEAGGASGVKARILPRGHPPCHDGSAGESRRNGPRDWLDMAWRRKKLVLVCLVAAVVAAFLTSLSIKPVYRATGTLELNPRPPRVTKFQGLSPLKSEYTILWKGRLYKRRMPRILLEQIIGNHVNLLQSEALARRVIEKLGLEHHPSFHPDGIRDKRLEVSLEQWFAKSLDVRAEKGTVVLSLAFSSTDPMLASDAVNTLMDEFIAWRIDKEMKEAFVAKHQIEQHLEDTRSQLEMAEGSLNSFACSTGIVSLDPDLNLVYRELETINKALAVAGTERVDRETLYDQARNGTIESMPSTLQNPLIQELRAEHARSTARYHELAAAYKDDHPRLAAARNEMHHMEEQIGIEAARVLKGIENSCLAVRRKEELLSREAERKKAAALEFDVRASQYRSLEREVEASARIYENLLLRALEMNAIAATVLPGIRVVDYARVPLRPYKPGMPLSILLGMAAGLILGVGLATFLESLDRPVTSIEEVSGQFAMPVLGILPVADPDKEDDLDFVSWRDPACSFAEAIRSTRLSIQLSMDHPPESILITSTTPSEGKSTIALNLAQSFAASGERVVIVDADLRKPRLHRAFNSIGAAKGLSHFLNGMCPMEKLLQQTSIPNLCFVAAGPIPPNPSRLFSPSLVKFLLDRFCADFDRVVIDAPPTLGFAEVSVLTNYVSGVVMVTTLGLTSREALRIFRRNLLLVDGCLLGSIVNKVSQGHGCGGYLPGHSSPRG